MKRVLILTDEELDLILAWETDSTRERSRNEDDEALVEKIRTARLSP